MTICKLPIRKIRLCKTRQSNYLLWSGFGLARDLEQYLEQYLEIARLKRLASLAAAVFLRYATHSKLARSGVLDDLRRH
jgi:hypothetical protein